jgi:hypothetical protein
MAMTGDQIAATLPLHEWRRVGEFVRRRLADRGRRFMVSRSPPAQRADRARERPQLQPRHDGPTST